MKAIKIVAAIMVAAMFIVLPIASAEDSEAKSWADGSTAAYYKATGTVFGNSL